MQNYGVKGSVPEPRVLKHPRRLPKPVQQQVCWEISKATAHCGPRGWLQEPSADKRIPTLDSSQQVRGNAAVQPVGEMC